MFGCFVGECAGSHGDPDRIVATAACLVDSGEVEGFDRRWRHLHLRHGLKVADPGGWRALTGSKDPKAVAAIGELAAMAVGGNRLAFIVGMRASAWEGLGRKRQRLFGSIEAFCFLKAMRNALDRLEASGATAPVALHLARDVEALGRHATMARQLYKTDSRAAERVATVAFVDPRMQCQLSACDLLLHLALPRLCDAAVADGASSAGLPGLPAHFELEMWDVARTRRSIASLEWSMSSDPVEPPKR